MPYKDPATQREYQRQWKDERRKAWIAQNGPCVDCGSWKDPEVDHVDPKTKIEHKVWSWREARRLAELSKCVVRCRECHILKGIAGDENASRGEAHPGSKLTDHSVKEIRRRLQAGERGATLALEYKVSKVTISAIKHRKLWIHI